MPAGDYLVSGTGSLMSAGSETAHLALQLGVGAGAPQTLAEADLVLTAATASSGATGTATLHVPTAPAACGDALVLHVTHPAGTQTVFFFSVSLDLP